jgi:hypothetical protein
LLVGLSGRRARWVLQLMHAFGRCFVLSVDMFALLGPCAAFTIAAPGATVPRTARHLTCALCVCLAGLRAACGVCSEHGCSSARQCVLRMLALCVYLLLVLLCEHLQARYAGPDGSGWGVQGVQYVVCWSMHVEPVWVCHA